MKKALITGISGQDGSYLTEQLLSKGYQILGTSRNAEAVKNQSIDYKKHKIEIVDWDACNATEFNRILNWHKPDEVYNLTAFSTGSGMYENPLKLSQINGQSVVQILNSIHKSGRNIKFLQASSSEIFRGSQTTPQNENTIPFPQNPYGIAKLYAQLMTKMYRENFGIFACSAILYNHESPRRGVEFVTRKVVRGAVKIKLGLDNKLKLGNLDAKRDWGFAGDYTNAMHLMLQSETPNDFIIATGKLHSVRELCDVAFRYLDLDYKEFVTEDVAIHRIDKEVDLTGDSQKIRSELGWSPNFDFESLIQAMTKHELLEFKKQKSSL
jgi:GDPmannose 4,6-dehydratase